MNFTWDKLGIDLSKVAGGKTVCPKCSHTRIKNPHEKCLSVDIERGLFNCHHCSWGGIAIEAKKKKEYVKPLPRLEKVGQAALKFFEHDRKISNNTILRFGITEAKEWMPQFEKEVPVICFNYIRDGELVNIKFRGPQKSFKMAKDSELIFYNLDAIADQDDCVIVEGEIDALTLHECGIHNVVSVPNGASKGNQKLEYLDNCWEYFASKKKVILMTDNDEAGQLLRDELARRIGKEKCYKVYWPKDCKDANEVYIKEGAEVIKEMIDTAFPWPIDGIITMDDMLDDVERFYRHGYPSGTDLKIAGFDDHLKLAECQMTVVTGIPGSGKSEWVDMMMVNTARHHEWSWGVCSFETQPSSLHVTKLQEKFVGKAFGFRVDPNHRMNEREFEWSIVMVDKYFHLINIDENDLTIDGLLEKGMELVKRKGIKGFMIDPWNYIEHKVPPGYSETQYISEALTKVKRFARISGCHVIIVAHPTKMKKENGKYEVPTLYHISGSAHFFNKTDNGISIYRDFESNQVDVYVQKVKHSWLGKLGFCTFGYDINTRQYFPY